MDETLMTYLRNIISLEQAVYVETNVTKRLRGGRAGVDTRRHAVKEPVKPPKHVGVDWDSWLLITVFGTPIFAIAGALLWLIYGDDFFSRGLLIMIAVGIVIGIGIVTVHFVSESRKEDRKNHEAYQIACKQYPIKLEKENRRYQLALEKADYLDRLIKAEQEKLTETQRVLQQLYDRGLLYSKYRNVVAVCSIYEYFESGRCTELTGPDGAYNKFDTELQFRRIEGKLDTVIQKLDEVRTSQEMLCSMVEAGNRLTGELIGKTSESIRLQEYSAEQSAIAAYNTAQAANEAGVCKWMMLLK